MIDFIAIPEERLRLLRKIKEERKNLENLTAARITLNEDVGIECDDPIMRMRIKEVLKAFGRGFSLDDALNLLDDEYYLEIINLKDFAGKSEKRIEVLKGIVIGSEGKSKNLIEKYTETKIAIYGKTISIIGRWEGITKAGKAIEMFLNGSSHNSVYRFLGKANGE
jgi:ribosomal RNA assembly protein